MGDWCIIIRGSGPHHNHQQEDADILAALFLQHLKNSGHLIRSAEISIEQMEILQPEHREVVNGPDLPTELSYLRWWYVMHMPNTHGNFPSREDTRALWRKNTGKEVPKGYRDEDEVW